MAQMGHLEEKELDDFEQMNDEAIHVGRML